MSPKIVFKFLSKNKITQGQLADYLGYSGKWTIAQWKRRQSIPQKAIRPLEELFEHPQLIVQHRQGRHIAESWL
jgi:DNA-binding transcriptional regulator YiaG